MSSEVEKIIADLRKRMAEHKSIGVRATGVWDKDLEVLMKAAERVAELERAPDERAIKAVRSAILYLSGPVTPWSDEQVLAVIGAYRSAALASEPSK